MKNKWAKIILSVAMLITTIFPNVVSVKATASEEYEIYPTVQKLDYKEGNFIIQNSVNVVFEEGIDTYTQQKLTDVLKNKGIQMNVGSEKTDATTNILVGIKDSGKYVDTYAKNNVAFDASTFEGTFDPYVLDIQDGVITILGESSDGAYYGIVSLMHILNQIDGKRVRNLTINDYADTQTRGFIEGYYGIPWSNEDRMALMEFGGNFKMTSYIFAPKDDPYHKNLWREEYPQAELNEIKKMVEVGLASKCRFVWTAHPFMGGFDANRVDEEIAALLNKFEQLYAAGVRQFGVLGDDVGNLDRNVVIKMMNAVSEWGEAKGDVYDPVFCPAGYNHSWQGDYSELNAYDEGFPQNVQIFWTGEAVCQPVEQKTLDHFRKHNLPSGKQSRRAPLFWLNWPVNDINMNRLLMGKGSLLHNNVNPKDLSGVVTNPMQDAHASKVALFAVADFAWNVSAFDADKSWKDSFKYIDEDAYEELYTLAKHMSDPSPNGHGLVLEESEELAPLLDDFLDKFNNGGLQQTDYERLLNEFTVIKQACADFHKKSKNEDLKEELLPFTNALSDQMDAAIYLIQTQMALDANNSFDVWSNYSQATAKIASSQTYQRPVLDGNKVAMPGSKRITPFITKLNELLAPKVNSVIDDTKIVTSLITNRTDTPNNALENLTDNNEKSEVIWSNPNSVEDGTYIGLSYNKPIHVSDITFKMGQSGNASDTFQSAKIQYSEDGKTWKDIEGSAYTDRRAVVSVEGLDLQVKGIRLISTQKQTNMWLGCKDIIVNKKEQPSDQDQILTGKGIYNTENMTIRNGQISQLTDGNTSEYVGFAKAPYEGNDKDTTLEGAWVGIEFDQPTKVNHIVIEQATPDASNDRIDTATLEYSEDGTEWKTIRELSNLGAKVEVSFDTVTAKKIRLVNKQAKNIWWRVREITASLKANAISPSVFVSDRFQIYGSNVKENMLDGNEGTFAWFSYSGDTAQVDDYVGLDLGKEVYLHTVYFSMGSDFWDTYDLEYSLDGQTYKKIQTLNGQKNNLDLTKQNIKARYVRMVNKKTKKAWLKVNEFQVTGATEMYRGLENLFTNLNVDMLTQVFVNAENDKTELKGVKDVVLKPNDYIGVKLSRIKDITNIDVSAVDGLEIQSSKNAIVWNDVSAKTDLDDARYVRAINTSDRDITCTFDKFIVSSHEIEPISVVSTNFKDEASHLNAFDKDRTTEAVWQGSQVKGSYITYDLGQEIDLQSLKLVLHDGTTDFPRHAKVSVSTDGKAWKGIMMIGNQEADNKGEAENTDSITDLFPNHEISYNTLEAKDLNTKARYIKFEITRNKAGADKWVRIREIELNGGNMYLPSSNDPTILSDSKELIESNHNTMLQMIDGNVSTTFQPTSKKAGSFTYYLSENTDVTKVSILQSPSTLSNAEVIVEVEKDGKVEKVSVGRLMSSLNEFDVSAFDHLLSVTVKWNEDMPPVIHEIITAKSVMTKVDKTALIATLENAQKIELDNLTPASVQALNDAIALGKEIKDNIYATQTMVDSAVAQLKAAMEHKVVKPDLNAYAAKLEEIIKDVLPQENYLYRTWRVYEERLANAQAAKSDENISQAELDALLEKLENGVAQLEYEINSIEELQVLYEKLSKLHADDYTVYTFEQLKSLLSDAKALIEKDALDRQLPSVVKAMTEKLSSYSKNTLLSKAEVKKLEDAILAAEKIDLGAYTPATAQILRDAISKAKEIAANTKAVKQDVVSAMENLQKAIEQLLPLEELEGVRAEIDRLKNLAQEDYTEASYQAMQKEINRVEEALRNNGTDYDAYLKVLREAEKNLVSIVELRNVIQTTEAMDMQMYAQDSIDALHALLKEAKELYVDGSEKAIAEMIKTISEEVNRMYLNADYVQAQIKDFAVLLNGNYTENSKKEMQKLLIEIESKQDQMTMDLLQSYVEKLEKAKAMLVDTTELLHALEEAKNIDSELYTASSFEKYTAIINDIEKLLINGSVTEIQDALQDLKAAKEVLVEQASVDKLQALIDKYSNMDLNTYTEDSRNALLAELEIGRFMILEGNASENDIASQIKRIEAAASGLVKKANPNEQEKDEVGNVHTGDTTAMNGWIALMMVSIIAGCIVYIRKKRYATK